MQSAWKNCTASIGTVTSFPTEKEKYIIHEVELSLGIIDSSFINIPATVLLYEKKTENHTSTLNYGDKIRIEGQPYLISEAKNPFEFDYSQYMSDRHIYLQQFVTSEQITLIERNQGNGLMTAIYRIRTRFEQSIKDQVKGKDEQAIVLALLLGIKGQLDTEIKTAYAAAGAMHVLAVSGLHVSIIYFLLNWLFKGIPPGSFKRFAVPTISIVALWLYALLTGFSPSILRAVTMFSIIIFSKVLDRKTEIFNSLAFAAFVLLVFDPIFLFNIGFQLSFLAVAGIVYIYPRLYALLDIQSIIWDYVWKLTCVSLAAQIATFPLSLYYFHQFPSYFLVANLVVIPAAFIIMILGLGVLILGPFTSWIGRLLEKMVSFMNKFVDYIYQWDGSVIDWLFVSEFQTLLIYTFITCLLCLLRFKRFSYAWLMLFIIVGFSLNRTWHIVQGSNRDHLVFYSSIKYRLIDQAERFNAQLFSLDSLHEFDKIKQHINPFRLHNHLPASKNPQTISGKLEDFASMHVFKQKRTLFLTKSFDIDQVKFRLNADIVVISNQSVDSLSLLDQIIDFKEVIVDNTNSPHYSDKLKEEARNLEMKLISLHDQAHVVPISRNQKFLNMLF